jgi:light-regulated signal transduction histidine kinase (bacteriophytochrome)
MPTSSHAATPPSPTPDRELAEFGYVVSHDLGNCFRQISAFLDLLRDDLGADLTTRQRAYVDRVCEASISGRAMLEALLMFSRIQNHRLSLADCDANDMAKDALIALRQQISESGAVFELGDLGRVSADPDLLAEIFQRVFDNAIKFRRPGEPPRVQVSLVRDDRDWIVQVQDDGVGVPPAQVETIFRMFHRLEPGRRDAGVGAGLTICRRVARVHGGDVVLRGGDRGACVEIRLPKTAIDTAIDQE